jgi:cardiolipin synthase
MPESFDRHRSNGRKQTVKILVQPGEGVAPLVKAIAGAKKSVEIVIFRFGQREIEKALGAAVARGVPVQALIAHTNRAGEENLRALEMRLLAAGVTVARTADDLVRYHSKYMIIDRRELFVLAFNLTLLDIERSRSFGVATRDARLVAEAAKLFEADTQRKNFESSLSNLVVSPVNARKCLGELLRSAKKELVIYDLKVSDQEMVRILEERAKAGVSVRIIGRLMRKIPGIVSRKMPQLRLHTRTIVVDGRVAFIGSQSLRETELDARREVGVILKDAKAARTLLKVFEEDWALTEPSRDQGAIESEPVERAARKVAKAVKREMPAVMPVLHGALKEAVGERGDVDLNPEEVEDIVKVAVKAAVKEALRNVVDEAAEQNGTTS